MRVCSRVMILSSLLSASLRAYRLGGRSSSTITGSSARFCFDSKLGNLPSEPVASAEEALSEREDYLFGSRKTFASLGVIPALTKALEKLNRPIATSIQAATYSELIEGRDVVIAAETGSGKTLSFLGECSLNNMHTN